ncbi:MAG: nucleotidyltransferase domain-containing protein [Candidatus Brennerbacteria bacterium]|nr:nucleotidyltransferase domain-containing protein [Candidatus Brennerbacteria bacterium]
MNQITEKTIRDVTDKIVREFQPDKIILFGSYAWGTPTEDSDVDLFIVKETKNTRELAREIDGSIFPRPFPIDLIVYKPEQIEKMEKIGDFFIRNILRRGKTLYAK